jgi:hypothetical protein
MPAIRGEGTSAVAKVALEGFCSSFAEGEQP